ncbi:glycosyltransferase [Bacillus nitratireducens]|uniref:glycosyltransferase n=1 Tax=Bacillus nitratireducens TaxID=2026193 RepID=UPI002E247E45|nr:glycosyltransferase [Bacillus nitratireducens]
MKKKVVFLSAKMSLGGAERVISNLVNSLSNQVEVHTLLLYKQTKNDYPLKGKVVSLCDNKKRNRIAEIPYYCSKIREYVKVNKIDCIISFMEYPNLLNMMTPVRVKKIVSVRNFMSEKWKGKKGLFWKLGFRLLYPKASAVVCPTQVIIDDMENNYKVPQNKLKLIYNPYEIEKLSENMKEVLEEEYKSWFNGNTIITMGSLSLAKGHCHLIRSFAVAKKHIPNLKLVILGEGVYRNKLMQLTKDLQISNDVLFLGFQVNPHKFIRQSDIYVLSSYYEGFPNALAEAMVCGLPVISTDCKSGPREILAPDTDINYSAEMIEYAKYGVLCPAFKVDCFDAMEELSIEEQILSEAIINLMQDKALYEKYKEKSYERVSDFHIKNVLKQWLELLV